MFKKITFLIFLVFASCNLLNKQKLRESETNYPYLGLSIEYYFHNNFQYPNSVKNLVNFSENKDSLNISYQKIIENGIENYFIQDSSDYFVIKYKKNTITSLNKINICASLKQKKLYPMMLNKIANYKNGKNISFGEKHKIEEDLINKEIIDILSNYSKNKEVYFDLLVIKNDSLFIKCNSHNFNKSYFDELKKMLLTYKYKSNYDSIKLIVPLLD